MREFIDRTGLVGKLQILTNCNFESANSTVEALPKVTEQEIVKSDLHKLAVQILEKYSGLDICEHLDEYDWDENDISYYKQVGNIGDIMDMIDNILSEQEKEK